MKSEFIVKYLNYSLLVWYSLLEISKIILRCNSDVVLICSDGDRGDEKDGKPYSKIIDSIHEELQYRKLKITQVSHLRSILIGDKAWGKPISITNFILLSEIIDKKLKADDSVLIKAYKIIYWLLNPNAVIAIGLPHCLCIALSELKIPAIEVLHGIGYFDLDNFKGLYDRSNPNELPSHILSLDKVSTKTLEPLKKKGVEIIEIPHPWYKRFINVENDNDTLDPKWIEQASYIPKNKIVILITLAWGYSFDEIQKSGIINDIYYPNLKDVIKETNETVFYCLRRHPVTVRSKEYDYQKHYLDEFVKKYKNCEWENSTNLSLMSILKKCDGHITRSSMTAYEVAQFGLKTLLLCSKLNSSYNNFFIDLIENDYATKEINNKLDMKNWILSLEKMIPYKYTDKTNKDWEEFVNKLIIK